MIQIIKTMGEPSEIDVRRRESKYPNEHWPQHPITRLRHETLIIRWTSLDRRSETLFEILKGRLFHTAYPPAAYS
jgi:hypothetical protein